MPDAQDQNAQDLILDPHHDAPVADPVAPKRPDPGTARGAYQRLPKTARIVHLRDPFAARREFGPVAPCSDVDDRIGQRVGLFVDDASFAAGPRGPWSRERPLLAA